MLISRRGLITGLVSFVAAPAIVRASSLMPVKSFDAVVFGWDYGVGDRLAVSIVTEIGGVKKTTLLRPDIDYKLSETESTYEVLLSDYLRQGERVILTRNIGLLPPTIDVG